MAAGGAFRLVWASPQAPPDLHRVAPAAEDGHTTYLAVVDKDRNMVSITYPHEVAGTLQVPNSVPEHVLNELAAMGHKLDLRNVRGVGSVKAIIVHPKTGVLMGGVSPTRDSYVMAY